MLTANRRNSESVKLEFAFAHCDHEQRYRHLNGHHRSLTVLSQQVQMHLVQFVSQVLLLLRLVAERLVELLAQTIAVLLWTNHLALTGRMLLVRIATAMK